MTVKNSQLTGFDHYSYFDTKVQLLKEGFKVELSQVSC